jgi:hypothetical protein
MGGVDNMQDGLPPSEPSSPPNFGQKVKKALGPVGAALVVLVTKFKFAILAVVKYLPLLLKTGGTMILSIGLYASPREFGSPSDLSC